MPYTFHWYDADHSIIQLDMYDDVTWDAYNQVIDDICEEIERTPHQVYLIFNDTTGMPQGRPIRPLKRSYEKLKQKNIGMVVIVSPWNISAVSQTILRMAFAVYGFLGRNSVPFVETIDEAVELIEKRRASHDTIFDEPRQ